MQSSQGSISLKITKKIMRKKTSVGVNHVAFFLFCFQPTSFSASKLTLSLLFLSSFHPLIASLPQDPP